jgi:aldose 1-epimerase
MLRRFAFLTAFAALATACSTTNTPTTDTGTPVPDNAQHYGTLPDGRTATLYTLTNTKGMTATVTDFGAILVSLEAPDRDGNVADVTVGYDTLDGWINDGSYMGATVGRYGNRIAKGKFTLDDTEYTLATNNDPNHLHGGIEGFNKKLWTAEQIGDDKGEGVQFTYVSADGEEGYPGELTAVVTYMLTDDNELIIQFTATTTAPTVVNLVHHTYWNLTGDPSKTILDHKLMILADGYTPIDETSIPNNGIQPVEDTPFDFRSATAIGKRINTNDQQLKNGIGYDHSWAINGEPGTLRNAAVLYDPASGRIMQIQTDQPAIQFYSGNFMDGSTTGKGGVPHNYRTGLCLETQVFPDSPNQPDLSNAVLRPGETYSHTMVHAFKTKSE